MKKSNHAKVSNSKRFRDEVLELLGVIRPTTYHYLALLLLLFIGILLLYISGGEAIDLHKLMHEVGVLFVTITPILFIYELALRGHFLKTMNESFDSSDFRKDLIKHLRSEELYRINDNGITDAYGELKSNVLIESIQAAVNSDIRILKIYLPYTFAPMQTDIIVESIIKNNCNFRIILLDYECGDIIHKRHEACRKMPSESSYVDIIKQNLDFFKQVWIDLDAEDKKLNNPSNALLTSKLKVKLYNDFIAGSFVGIEDYFLLGVYLRNKLATDGLQIKITKKNFINNITKNTSFYTQIDKHFEDQWKKSYKTVVFTETNWQITDAVNAPDH